MQTTDGREIPELSTRCPLCGEPTDTGGLCPSCFSKEQAIAEDIRRGEVAGPFDTVDDFLSDLEA